MRRAGANAFLLECATLGDAIAIGRALQDDPPPGTVDVVPGARTVLVTFGTAVAASRARAGLEAMEVLGAERIVGRRHEIEVVYDGPDLDEVAATTGLSRKALVTAHSLHPWTVAFGGFAPGFAYLVDGDPRLQVARREVPRVRVPAGSVGLADAYSAVYPRESPGGWQLIGRTDAVLWDLDRAAPALLGAGDVVRFVPVLERILAAGPRPTATPAPAPAPAPTVLRVESPGFAASIQDEGRPRHAHQGVGVSGALDRAAYREVNRLVGNVAGEAVVEIAPGGFRCCAEGGDVVIAVTGAVVELEIDGPRGVSAAPTGAPFALHDGERLQLGLTESGFRAYLGIRGGIGVPTVFGSRSTDTLAGLGPEPIAAGTLLPVGDRHDGPVQYPARQTARTTTGALHVRLGPRDDRFEQAAVDAFLAATWTVTPSSDRVGVRFRTDEAVVAATDPALPSEGIATGSIQMPPSGEAILFLADHPVTGGYPVIAVVEESDLDRAAQLSPGADVRFVPIEPEPDAEPPDALGEPRSARAR